LIKAFEYCFELGWNTLRDLLLAEGNADLIGSRDTLRLALRVGLIRDGEGWLAMVQDRNLTSHTYNRSTAEQVSQPVGSRYLPCFRELRQVLTQRQASAGKEEGGWLSIPPSRRRRSRACPRRPRPACWPCSAPSLRCRRCGSMALGLWAAIAPAPTSTSPWWRQVFATLIACG
jgi:nucleotidyltransferase substrate binding protein (TIGR01987 family)